MTNVKESEEKSLSFSGGSYPIRFAVSEDGKPGSITVLNETDFVVLKKFILEPSSFLEASSFSMESEKNGMVTKSGGYKITMENSYQGKTFKNEDTIDFDTWNKLKTLSEEGKYDAMALLLKNVKLEKNKFVSAATTKTMSFSKEEYLTYRVSRSNAGVIDENAVMLQISYQKEDDKYIISMLKGDVRK